MEGGQFRGVILEIKGRQRQTWAKFGLRAPWQGLPAFGSGSHMGQLGFVVQAVPVQEQLSHMDNKLSP